LLAIHYQLPIIGFVAVEACLFDITIDANGTERANRGFGAAHFFQFGLEEIDDSQVLSFS
jgi:hypothetical protein